MAETFAPLNHEVTAELIDGHWFHQCETCGQTSIDQAPDLPCPGRRVD